MKTIILTLFLLPLACLGQKQGNIWYFGGSYNNQSFPGAGLDFNSGSAVALTNSALPYTEGSAAYCNSGGQLLFYTNGVLMFDRTHNLMMNGDSLGGHWSSQQSALIVPVTGDTNKYFVFCNDGWATGNGTGLYYSTIDMTLNAGFGAVMNPKAINLVSSTSEQLTGCKHANGIDFWVITSDYYTCMYYAYRVTPTAVMPPVLSYPGLTIFSNTGSLEISPNGDKIAAKQYGTAGGRYLLDFDKATGVISNPFQISLPNNYNSGCSFSPNGNLFYDVERTSSYQHLNQYDLNAPDILASKVLIANLSLSSRFDLQRGPDGRIYFSGIGPGPLDVINYPNVSGVGCDYQAGVIGVAGFDPGKMLPNEILIAGTVSGLNDNVLNENIHIYPNPFTDAVSVNTNTAAQTEIILRDAASRIVMQQPFRNSVKLQAVHLPNGVYLYEIRSNTGLIKSGKIVKH